MRIVATFPPQAGLAFPPGERTVQLETTHLSCLSLLALPVLLAGGVSEGGEVGRVPTPAIDAGQAGGTLGLLSTADCLAANIEESGNSSERCEAQNILYLSTTKDCSNAYREFWDAVVDGIFGFFEVFS